MKINKILSLAITLMLVLSVASIPAMAADLGVAYENVTISATTYTLEQFKADFSTADYAAVETFEDSTISTTAAKNVDIVFSIPVDGVNCNYTLNLSRGSSKHIALASSAEGQTFSSGTKALNITNIGSGLEFTLGEVGNNSDLKLTGFGWTLSAVSSSPDVEIIVTYSNNKFDTITPSLIANNGNIVFVGIKAPENEYITAINVSDKGSKRAAYVDDIALIFEEVAPPVAPESITVNAASETVAEPQYNGSKTVQFTAVDQDDKATPATWSVTKGNGATIDAESGLLTLKRTEGASIAGDVTVVATSKIDGNVVGEKTISVTKADAYFASSEMSGSNATAYTRDDFVAGLNAATHKAVMNFENSTEYTITKGNIAFSTAVSGNGGTFGCNLQAYKADNTANTVTYADQTGNIRFPKLSGETGYHAIEWDTSTSPLTGGIEPTAVGFRFGDFGASITYCLSIYLDGEENAIVYDGTLPAGEDQTKYGFIGYKAPGGRYIKKIKIETNSGTNLDDICFIFENPSAAPIKFSTDEDGKNLIGAISGLTGDIYINVKAGTLETGEKAILALYDGNTLIDVAIVEENATQAMATVPSENTLTTVKAFVWNMERLVPVQNDIVLDK